MIELNNLNIELPGFTIRDVSLRVTEGQFFALLGPTGAGKTLILEAIAGVAPVTSGRVAIRGKDVTRLPPERRNVGIVYQDIALFPHLSAMDNIRYGLRYHRSVSAPEDQTVRVRNLITMLGLEHLVDRSVQTLSGGEKQRIALARCLAVNPSLVLLDEPLSALDANKRDEIMILLKDLHENLGITFLMVTHEFSQVMFLAQQAAIIHQGRLEQVGPVAGIFHQPRTPFVAQFVGMKNLWPASFRDNVATVNGLSLRLGEAPAGPRGYVGIRPEDIVLAWERPLSDSGNVFPATIISGWNVGPYYEVIAQAQGVEFRVYLTPGSLPESGPARGANVYVAFDSGAIHAL